MDHPKEVDHQAEDVDHHDHLSPKAQEEANITLEEVHLEEDSLKILKDSTVGVPQEEVEEAMEVVAALVEVNTKEGLAHNPNTIQAKAPIIKSFLEVRHHLEEEGDNTTFQSQGHHHQANIKADLQGKVVITTNPNQALEVEGNTRAVGVPVVEEVHQVDSSHPEAPLLEEEALLTPEDNRREAVRVQSSAISSSPKFPRSLRF
jgi:hypothetical protein